LYICNKHFKFGLFFETAKKLGCNYIATGHYAKIKDNKLYMSDVATKDQSYFLYGISKEILKHVIFPLQGYEDKVQIRKIAEEIGLKISDKKDSQEVCFIPNDDYKAYLNNYLDEAPKEGDICLEDGTVLGKHNGLINYTIGQRKGLNISYKTPLYVTRLDRDNNRLIVSDNEGLFNKSLIAKDINLLVDNWDFDKEIYAKVRSRGVPKRCNISLLPDNQAKINFLEEVRAITPGQSVVFYDKDGLCIGGGIIIES